MYKSLTDENYYKLQVLIYKTIGYDIKKRNVILSYICQVMKNFSIEPFFIKRLLLDFSVDQETILSYNNYNINKELQENNINIIKLEVESTTILKNSYYR